MPNFELIEYVMTGCIVAWVIAVLFVAGFFRGKQ